MAAVAVLGYEWVGAALSSLRPIHVFSWDHFSPASLTPACCKVKSVRVFGDIMDEWSQVE